MGPNPRVSRRAEGGRTNRLISPWSRRTFVDLPSRVVAVRLTNDALTEMANFRGIWGGAEEKNDVDSLASSWNKIR